MKVECPHCHKDFELLEPGDIRREYDISGNKLLDDVKEGLITPHARTINRNFYLRDEVSDYVTEKQSRALDSKVDGVVENLFTMPPEEQVAALKRITERLDARKAADTEKKLRETQSKGRARRIRPSTPKE